MSGCCRLGLLSLLALLAACGGGDLQPHCDDLSDIREPFSLTGVWVQQGPEEPLQVEVRYFQSFGELPTTGYDFTSGVDITGATEADYTPYLDGFWLWLWPEEGATGIDLGWTMYCGDRGADHGAVFDISGPPTQGARVPGELVD